MSQGRQADPSSINSLFSVISMLTASFFRESSFKIICLTATVTYLQISVPIRMGYTFCTAVMTLGPSMFEQVA